MANYTLNDLPADTVAAIRLALGEAAEGLGPKDTVLVWVRGQLRPVLRRYRQSQLEAAVASETAARRTAEAVLTAEMVARKAAEVALVAGIEADLQGVS